MKRVEKLRQSRDRKVTVHERTKEEREPRRLRKGFFIFVIVALFGGLLYLLLFSGAFTITKVKVEGYSNPKLIENMAENYKEKNILGDNIFFFRGGELEKTIKEDSGVKSVTVAKRYPQTIEIVVEEAIPAITWSTAGESFLVDERGYVIGINSEETLPVVYDSLNIKTALGERVASPTFIKYILDVSSNFEGIIGQKFEKIIIYDIFSDVRIKSDSTWTVYLDSSHDPVAELENLARVLKEAKAEGNTAIKYIDMRLPDKVFYK